jgi:hypothetical protein
MGWLGNLLSITLMGASSRQGLLQRVQDFIERGKARGTLITGSSRVGTGLSRSLIYEWRGITDVSMQGFFVEPTFSLNVKVDGIYQHGQVVA